MTTSVPSGLPEPIVTITVADCIVTVPVPGDRPGDRPVAAVFADDRTAEQAAWFALRLVERVGQYGPGEVVIDWNARAGLTAEEHELLKELGGKLACIKAVRERLGLSLGDAVRFVDQYK